MKKLLLLLCLALLLCGCGTEIQPTQATAVQPETTVATVPTETETIPETTIATESTTVPTTVENLFPPEVGAEPTYIANTNTKKFHYPECSSVSDIYEENKQPFYGSREQLLEAGFDPCGRCHP